jgi:hypothetical protein
VSISLWSSSARAAELRGREAAVVQCVIKVRQVIKIKTRTATPIAKCWKPVFSIKKTIKKNKMKVTPIKKINKDEQYYINKTTDTKKPSQ